MPSVKPQSRWLFVVSPRWLTWHAFALVCSAGMLALGDWQFHRAESGNALSWAYTFEWPIFTIFVLVFWVKTIADEYRHPGGAGTQAAAATGPGEAGLDLAEDLPNSAHYAGDTADAAADDPELAAYNAYLARLNKQASNREAGSAH
jgi:hypothetical protein